MFIVDDSLFSRSWSKKAELLAKVYDHVSHKFVRGFRMLTPGWSDGNSFVRDRNCSRQWLALLSMDTSLTDDEVIRIYGKRWDIECFFKVSKSHLRLAKELQGRTYDQMFARTTIVFTP